MRVVTETEIEAAKGKGDGDHRLSVGVSGDFMALVKVAAAQRRMSIRELVIESVLKNVNVNYQGGR
jgi:hypothetical protein